MGMTHEERKLRRLQIVEEYVAGASIRALSSKYGLGIVYTTKIVTWGTFPFEPVEPKVPRAAKKEPEAKTVQDYKQNLADAEEKFQLWKLEHIKTCADLPEGECCRSCHANDGVLLLQRHTTVFFVCCKKLRANYEAVGYKADTVYRFTPCQ